MTRAAAALLIKSRPFHLPARSIGAFVKMLLQLLFEA